MAAARQTAAEIGSTACGLDCASEPSIAFLYPFAPSYIRTRHNNLRCFPSCARVHRDNSFCGRSVELKLIKSLVPDPRKAIVFASFTHRFDPPAFAPGERVTKAQLVSGGRNSATTDYFLAEYINANEKYYRYVFAPDKKWRYDARVTRLDEHSFRVYVAVNDTVLESLDSSPFEIVPVWKSEEPGADKSDSADRDQSLDDDSGGQSGKESQTRSRKTHSKPDGRSSRELDADKRAAANEAESGGTDESSSEEESDSDEDDDVAHSPVQSNPSKSFAPDGILPSTIAHIPPVGPARTSLANFGAIVQPPHAHRAPNLIPSTMTMLPSITDTSTRTVFNPPLSMMTHSSVPRQPQQQPPQQLHGSFGMLPVSQVRWVRTDAMMPGAGMPGAGMSGAGMPGAGMSGAGFTPRPQPFPDQHGMVMSPMGYVGVPMALPTASGLSQPGLPFFQGTTYMQNVFQQPLVRGPIYPMTSFPTLTQPTLPGQQLLPPGSSAGLDGKEEASGKVKKRSKFDGS